MPDNDFDQASRYAARHLDVPGFFRWLLGDSFLTAWHFLDWLDTQAVPFPGASDRRCDTVAAFERRNADHAPLAVVVEFMSQTRRVTLRRLTQYGLQIQEDCPFQHDPRVEYDFVGAVVNLTGGVQEETLTIAPPDVGELGLRARFAVRTLASMSAATMLEQVAAGQHSRAMLVWCPLMSDGDDEDLIRRWRAEVEREPDMRVRGDVTELALVFAELSKRKTLWQRVLEGMNVERSQVVLGWEQRGEQRGEQKATRRSLIEVLQARFGKELPSWVIQKIEAEPNVSTLTAWLATAATVDSLDKLNTAWQGNGH